MRRGSALLRALAGVAKSENSSSILETTSRALSSGTYLRSVLAEKIPEQQVRFSEMLLS